MEKDPRITVCVLLYGDYLDLARRCLSSILPLLDERRIRLRLGANSIGAETQKYIADVLPRCEYSFVSADNLCKYPVMRRLFYDTPITTPLTMWFDDDSYIRTEYDPLHVLDRIETVMTDADMIGEIWYKHLQGQQRLWVESRDWYDGRPVGGSLQVKFATGGWWTIKTAVLQKYNWPDPDILHRGGDVMLGELCRQQKLKLYPFSHGVAINADERGKNCAAKKRGFDELPVGHRYKSSN